jgi:DNA replication protein DnaC
MINNQIESHARELSLKSILENYEKVADKATKSKLTYQEYLVLLLEMEVKRKLENSTNTKLIKSKFPFTKTIDEFDFTFQPNLPEKEIIRLSSLSFIEEKSNVIFLGPPGVGKTHLSVGLGVKACLARYRVLFLTLKKLLEELYIAQVEGTLAEKLLFYSRLHLLIIDELGYMPITKLQANLLFQLVSARYEKGAIILTSNYVFDDWGQVFEDTVVAGAIVDRLIHHSSVFYINGSSYRLKDKIKRG